MLKLNKNYYIAVDTMNKLIGRFVNLKDAKEAVPIGYNCFGSNYKMGHVYYITEEALDLFNPNEEVNVYESYDEYCEDNNIIRSNNIINL